MCTQLERRLQELRAEYKAGQKMLAELEARQASTRETMLRISGAIQVLEEELGRTGQAAANGYVETNAGVEAQPVTLVA